jgi:hypothetical protein
MAAPKGGPFGNVDFGLPLRSMAAARLEGLYPKPAASIGEANRRGITPLAERYNPSSLAG